MVAYQTSKIKRNGEHCMKVFYMYTSISLKYFVAYCYIWIFESGFEP